MTLALLCHCKKENDTIPTVEISDDNFLQALIELGVDKNGDGIISPDEAEIITSLDLNKDSICNLKGIEAFINLDTLNCSNNFLSSLDFSAITGMVYLDCSFNELEVLNITGLTALTNLQCLSNNLADLDISGNIALEWIACYSNQLTELDVSNNSVLDISKNISLTDIDLQSMESLYEVCVWQMPFPPADVEVLTDNSPNIFFTTDCK